MGDYGLRERISELRAALSLIEASALENDSEVPPGLADFKKSVEDTRKSVWAVLTAANANEYHAFVSGFRLRRGIETFDEVRADIESGTVSFVTPGLDELALRLQELLETIPESGS